MNARNGTDVDAAAAMKIFSELGYKVNMKNDQTVDEMKQLLQNGNKNYSFFIHSMLPILLHYHVESSALYLNGPTLWLNYQLSGDICCIYILYTALLQEHTAATRWQRLNVATL